MGNLRTLLSGATLVITPREICEDAEALVQFIDANSVTIVDGFPYLMESPTRASFLKF